MVVPAAESCVCWSHVQLTDATDSRCNCYGERERERERKRERELEKQRENENEFVNAFGL